MKPTLDPKALERRIRQKVQGSVQDFWVVTHPGFERTVASEISQILATHRALANPVEHDIKTAFGGVEFRGRVEDCWLLNALARTPSRISMRIDRFRATQFPELVRKVAQIPWELFMSPHAEGQIQVTSRNSRLIHSDGIEERVAAGIALRLGPWRTAIPEHESVHSMPQTVLVRFESDECTISMDSSGELLFKRGFDKFTEDAPMRDTLAACMLREAGIDSCTHLVDPMAGSGTFAVEALLSRFPSHWPGQVRRFAFEEWPAFRTQAYAHMVKSLAQVQEGDPLQVQVSDKDSKAVQTIERNLAELKAPERALKLVRVSQRDFFATSAPEGKAATTLVTLNPPYGIRLSQGEAALFRKIGQHLRTNYRGCRYAVVCPTAMELDELNLPYRKLIRTKNGGLEVGVAFGTIP